MTGNGYFNAGSITLDNSGNSMGATSATISLNTSAGSASLTVTGSAQFAASNVAGTLDVTAGGEITQLPGLFGTPNDGVLRTQGTVSPLKAWPASPSRTTNTQ